MGVKDGKAKEFISDNKRFADLFNFYLFHGRQVIRAEELQERNVEEVLLLYGSDWKQQRHGVQEQRWRDLLKSAIVKSAGNRTFVLLGVEDQSKVHYAMPVRNMVYDSLNYGAQVNRTASWHKREKSYGSDGEFLSGFHKSDRLIPVITLTVYWGAGKWDGPRSLHEMFGEESRELLPFVDDYHLHLLVPDEIMDFGKFTTSLGRVLEVIKASQDKDKMEEVIMANPEYKELENEALSMINVFTELDIKADEKGEKTDMCKAWLDQRLDGVREGREEGIKEGIKEGREAGIKEGIKEGREAGIKEGIKEGIRVLILDNIEEGKSRDAVIGKLIRRFSLQESEAVEYYDAFAPVANAES